MSYCSVNGAAVVRGTISRPRTGIWHADVRVDARAAEVARFSGAVTLEIAGLAFTGTTVRVDAFQDALGVRLVGGAAGLGRVLPPRAYQNAPVRIPLTDICAGAGERLSARSDGGVLSQNLPKWVRMQQPAGNALASLLAAAGSPSWRILEDGSLWVGAETWRPIVLDQVDLTNVDAQAGRVELATDQADRLTPGGTWDGRRVSYVEHRVEARRLRHVLWLEDQPRG